VYTVNRVCEYNLPIIIATPLMFTTEVKFPVSKYISMLNTIFFSFFRHVACLCGYTVDVIKQ
jgi:hypothetical protein